MTRGIRSLCGLTVIGLALALGASRQGEPVAVGGSDKPNIIFILLDDQGWADAGAFGHPYMKTPSIDRLARESARFEQFYVNSPICSPSRTAFMTGHYPARHGVHQHFDSPEQNALRGMPDWLDADATTVADLAKSAGYATAHFGKWHLGRGRAPLPDAYGIDDHKTVGTADSPWRKTKGPYFRAESTGLFVDETIRFIKAHKGEPFYINLWTLVPHAKLKPTPQELAVYEDLQVKPKDFPSWMRRYVASAKDPTQQMKVFCAAMTGLDAALGRLLDFLDEEGLADDTVIFMSSDNGPEDYHIPGARNAGMGHPGELRARKRSLYEGGIRTPLLVRWPGHIEAGRRDKTSVLTGVDFLPTVAHLVGAELPADFDPDGEDVHDILTGEARERTRPILWEWRGGVSEYAAYEPPPLAIREGEWKLFVHYDGSGVKLYDIPADPQERTNLAAEHRDIAAPMKAKLLAWKKTLPPGPVQGPDGGRRGVSR